MKKIITTIILALLTSPAFADFKFKKRFVEPLQQFTYTVRSHSADKTFHIIVRGSSIAIQNRNIKEQLSSKTKLVSIKFDNNKPRTCSYPSTVIGLTSLNSKCYTWMVKNMKAGNTMTIQYYSKKEEFLEASVSLKGFTAAYRKLEKVTIR